MRDTAPVGLAMELEPEPRPAPPGGLATPVEASPSVAASPAALGALAGPQRAQAVAALQRGHGNAAVARLLAAAAGRRAPDSPGRPIAAEPHEAPVGGEPAGAGRPAANAAIAQMLAADRAGAPTGAVDQTAEQAAATDPARIGEVDGGRLTLLDAPDDALPPDPEHDPPAPPAHEIALEAPDKATATATDMAAHDAAPAPEPEIRGPPADQAPDLQAPPPAVDQLDDQQTPSLHAESGVDVLLRPEPVPAVPEVPEPASANAELPGAPEGPLEEAGAPDATVEEPDDVRLRVPGEMPAGPEGALEDPGAEPPMADDEPAPESDPAEDDRPFEEGSVGLIEESEMVDEGSGAVPAAPAETAEPEDTGPSLEAIALEQSELIQRDSAMSEARVAESTAASRQRTRGEFGEVRRGLAALLAGASGNVHAFIAGKQAEVSGVAAGVMASAQGAVAGAVQSAQAAAAAARDSINGLVAGVMASLQGRVQGIARQIAGALNGISLPDLPGVAQLRAAASGLVGRAAGAVTAGLGQVQSLIGSAVQSGAQLVSSLVADVGRLATTALTSVSGAIQRGVRATFGMLSRVGDMVVRGLRGFVNAAVLPAVNRVQARLMRALGTAQRQTVAAIRANRDEHLQALAAAREDAESGTGDGAAPATPEAAEAVRAIGQDAVEGNQSIVQTYEERTSSTLGSIFQAIAGGAARVAQHVGSVVAQAIGAVVSKVSAIVEGLRQIVAGVRAFVQALLQEAASALAGAVQFVRSLVEQPARQLIDFASGAWNRLTSFVGGFVRRLLSGDFGLPSVADVIGDFRAVDVRNGGPITKPPPGPITIPGLLGGLLLLVGVFGAIVVMFFPQLAAVIAALVAIGLAEAVAYVVVGAVALLVLILVLVALYLLFKLLRRKLRRPKKPKLEVTHETDLDATDGSPKTRTTVGVGELVRFKGTAAGAWTATAGKPATGTGKSFSWTAPDRPAGATVTLTSGSDAVSVSLDVVQPADISAIKLRELSFPPGRQGAGMVLNFRFAPLNVSFGNAESREVEGPASDIDGYYTEVGMPHFHTIKGHGTFFRIGEDNTFVKSRDVARQGNYPEPWDKGSFHWMIPNKFRVATEGGDGEKFTDVKQEFIIDETGKTTIKKAGAEVERAP